MSVTSKSKAKVKTKKDSTCVSPQKNERPISAFATGTFNDVVLGSFCDTAFEFCPKTIDDAVIELKNSYGWLNGYKKPRYTEALEPPPFEEVSKIEMPPGVHCPRFSEYQLVGETCDPMQFLEPEFLREADAQFSTNLLPTDVIDSLGMDFSRKQNTFYVLDTILASFKSRGITPNIIHHCDASYIPQLIKRFHGRGVGTVVFLHPKMTKLSKASIEQDMDLIEPVDYNYVFHHGSVADFVDFVKKQALYNATVADLYNNPDIAQEILRSLEGFQETGQTYAELNGLPTPGYVPTNYHLYFGMHDYEMVKTRAINDLSSILDCDTGVGMLTLVSPDVLYKPVTAAIAGYTILSNVNGKVDLFDTYTSKKFTEYRLEMDYVCKIYSEAGYVFGLATSSFYPNINLVPGAHFDQAFRVYGFHSAKPIAVPFPPHDAFSGCHTWDVVVAGGPMSAQFNNPTQASLWDVMHMSDCVYAPKASGYTGILHVTPKYVDLIFGHFTMRKNISGVFLDTGLSVQFESAAFQVEILLFEPDGHLLERFVPNEHTSINYVVVDMLGKGMRHVPFYCKWECVRHYFVNNSQCLQTYSNTWVYSDEGCVIQPLLHVSSDVVSTPTGSEVRSHAKSVKHWKLDNGEFVCCVNFCVPLPHVVVEDRKFTESSEQTLKMWEVVIYSHLGRFHIVRERLRPDRTNESLKRVPNNLASYRQFQHVVENSLEKFSPDSPQIRYALHKFKRILHALILESFQGQMIDGKEWEQLLVWKNYSKCAHAKFRKGCYPCTWAQEAARLYPQTELAESIANAKGFIFKHVRDEFYHNVPEKFDVDPELLTYEDF
jgi:hypothetical protein